MSEQVTQYYCKIDPIRTGEKIKSSILHLNIPIKELAKMMSVSQQAVYKWICGESLPSLENVVLLSSILNVPIDDLIVRSSIYTYQVEEIYVRECCIEFFVLSLLDLDEFHIPFTSKTTDSMAIPCSVNIYGLYLRLPLPFEVAFCDLKKVLRCYLLLSEV